MHLQRILRLILIGGSAAWLFASPPLPSSITQGSPGPLAKQAAGPGARSTPRPGAGIQTFRGVYLTCWSAGTKRRVDQVVDLARAGAINAVVIDVKDASGYVAYKSSLPAVVQYHARWVIIRDIDALVQRLHREGLYVIARVVVFQDPRLSLARPDLAVHRASGLSPDNVILDSSTLWFDRKGQSWMDTASREVWDYNIAIAREADNLGFDEVNFDYVRFPSDGKLGDMYFPAWKGMKPRQEVLKEFFAYLRDRMQGKTISADLFGLATVTRDDLGIGQVIEDAYRYFDYVCPMVYPSHYAPGFLGKKNPADFPFEVVNYSMKAAQDRLRAIEDGGKVDVRLRPWLQDFDLGADYDAKMVKAQINAAKDALGEGYYGFILWNPSSKYTRDALEREPAGNSGPQ
jgi:hypothetical protein